MPFRDRTDAGKQLARALIARDLPDPVIVGLPRGGVVVAAEVARALNAPLDVVLVRKVEHPDSPGLALGAVGEDGARIANRPLMEEGGIDAERFEDLAAAEARRLGAQLALYREARLPVQLDDRVVVVTDDGLTTGASASVAASVVSGRRAARVILAVPVSSPEAAERVRPVFDEVVCLETPKLMLALDEWYEELPDVTDDEVVALLASALRP
jgi:predicted phosphoribosyltransferase